MTLSLKSAWPRRQFLSTLLDAGSAWAAPLAWGQGNSPQADGRLVLVFLRGACDGLSALVPHGDRAYYALRPNIAVPAPDGTPQTSSGWTNTSACTRLWQRCSPCGSKVYWL